VTSAQGALTLTKSPYP